MVMAQLASAMRLATAAHIDAVYRRVQRFWDEQPDINQWSQY